MWVGIAEADITPPVGIPMGGFLFREQPSVGIHDRLYAKILVFSESNEKAVIVSCDLLGLDQNFVKKIRSLITKQTGICSQNIMIHCTHTHSGPATIFLRNCGEINKNYLDTLYKSINKAVNIAFQNLRNVKIGYGEGTCKIGKHRTVGEEKTDPRIFVLKVEDINGELEALLVNYACHPVVMAESNRLISADLPGAAAGFIKNKLGDKGIVIYTNGACGNINPVVSGGTFQDLKHLGSLLGEEVLNILNEVETKQSTVLKTATKEILLPLQLFERGEVEKQKAEYSHRLRQAIDTDNYKKIKLYQTMLNWAEDTIKLIQLGQVSEHVPLELQLITIGEVNLIGIPGEPFSHIGLNIRKQIPNPTVILGYTNGCIGYIPVEETYKIGAYEVEAYKFYGNFMLRSDSAQILEHEVIGLIKDK